MILDFGTPYPFKVNAVTLRAGYKVCLFSQAVSWSGSENGREKEAFWWEEAGGYCCLWPYTACTLVCKLIKTLPVLNIKHLYIEIRP